MWVTVTSVGLFAERRLEGVDVESALFGDIHPFEHGTLPFPQELPGHDVGMVLHDRQDDFIACADPRRHKARGHQVERVGRALGENDLFGARRVEELAHRLTRLFIGIGRSLRQRVQSAMHIGIGVLIGIGDRVDHRPGFLGRSAVVEIDQALAVYIFLEDREVFPNSVEIEAHACPRRSQVSATADRAPCKCSSATSSKLASRKARTSMACASARGMPRLIR